MSDQSYVDGGNVIVPTPEDEQQDRDRQVVEEQLKERRLTLSALERAYDQKLEELRQQFWQDGKIAEAEYQAQLKEVEERYRVQSIEQVSFGSSYYVLDGMQTYAQTRHMTREEFQARIQEIMEGEIQSRVDGMRWNREFLDKMAERIQLRESLGSFGDVADLSDVITEKPKRRLTWWDRLLDILYWLLDWIAPPDEKRKNEDQHLECGGFRCECGDEE